jgi:hypothetical protein
MKRRAIVASAMIALAAAAHAQQESGTIAPLPFQAGDDASGRITPPVRDESILTTKRPAQGEPAAALPWQKAEPAAQPVPFGRGESSGPAAQPDAAYQPKIPFGRAEPSGPVIPSGPHATEAVPVVGVDAVEASEPAPPTPVEPEADPVQQDPAEPTELTSPIFEPEQGARAPRKIVIRVLNKVTAQAKLISFNANETGKIGQLQVTAITCQKSAEKSQTDYAGLLDIAELPTTDKEKPKPLFRGWMYASSPSITALEHPVYDVTMVRCEVAGDAAKKAEDDAKQPADSKADKKPKAKPKN